VTLADVARAAGVSLATASRAVNGSPDRTVREDLRERVFQAAAELNYSPNAMAQAVARGRTSVVGVIVHDIADPYFSSIASGTMREAEEHGLIVTMATTQRDPGRELAYVRMLRAQRAQAVVLAGSRFDDDDALEQLDRELALLKAGGGRVAMISQRMLDVDTVVVENRAGARKLAYALHDLGHRRLAILGGPPELVTSRDRITGFREGLARRGDPLPSDHLVRAEFTRDGGYRAMGEVLDRGLDVTCVFAVNDVMAVGAMAALRDRGVPLPDGMAVAGFDDIATLRDVTPPLTTVRLPLEGMGRQALRLALSEPADRPRTERVAGEVIVRDSTPALTSTT
jgi:LacI family transcriptional regulator